MTGFLSRAGRACGNSLRRFVFPLVSITAFSFFNHASALAEPDGAVSSIIIPVDDACHTQGMDVAGDYLYVSCVDRKARRAYVYKIDFHALFESGEGGAARFQRADVTRGGQYHPSGIDACGGCIWLAVSEYHPAPAESTVMCLDPGTLEPAAGLEFHVHDHIGAVAASQDRVFGANWDARKFYVWDYSGNEIYSLANPGKAAYQDCKYAGGDRLLCGGVMSMLGIIKTRGCLDLIKTSGEKPGQWDIERRHVFKKSFNEREIPSKEAMCYSEGSFYFIPEDFPRPTMEEYIIDKIEIDTSDR